MASKLALDPRVDPRIKTVFAAFELPTPTSVASREELLAEESTASATPGRSPRAESGSEGVVLISREATRPRFGYRQGVAFFTKNDSTERRYRYPR